MWDGVWLSPHEQERTFNARAAAAWLRLGSRSSCLLAELSRSGSGCAKVQFGLKLPTSNPLAYLLTGARPQRKPLHPDLSSKSD